MVAPPPVSPEHAHAALRLCPALVSLARAHKWLILFHSRPPLSPASLARLSRPPLSFTRARHAHRVLLSLSHAPADGRYWFAHAPASLSPAFLFRVGAPSAPPPTTLVSIARAQTASSVSFARRPLAHLPLAHPLLARAPLMHPLLAPAPLSCTRARQLPRPRTLVSIARALKRPPQFRSLAGLCLWGGPYVRFRTPLSCSPVEYCP